MPRFTIALFGLRQQVEHKRSTTFRNSIVMCDVIPFETFVFMRDAHIPIVNKGDAYSPLGRWACNYTLPSLPSIFVLFPLLSHFPPVDPVPASAASIVVIPGSTLVRTYLSQKIVTDHFESCAIPDVRYGFLEYNLKLPSYDFESRHL